MSFIAILLVTVSVALSTSDQVRANVVSLDIQDSNTGQTVPTTMHGVIFETNINRGDDGGTYAELVYNRAFQGMLFFRRAHLVENGLT